MRVNWNRFILLMLPIRLRKSKLLSALLVSLTHYTRRKYDEEYVATLNTIAELRYTSQVKSFTYLLNNKFDNEQRRIYITDGTSGNVSFWKENELDLSVTLATDNAGSDYADSDVFFAVPDSETTVGEDFVVFIPQCLDNAKVKAFIDKYVFFGVGYIIKYI